MRLLRFTLALLSMLIAISFGACAKRSRPPVSTKAQGTSVVSANAVEPAQTKHININTASAKELEALPGIGKGLAERIVEHREKYGPFRRTEHLIIVRGISDGRFRALRDLITVE
jgi:competence protein ComEA